ncbi:MAG: HIT family protein [Cyclobacteriaceae bacterium]|nr:HIT family protein [Cyclobacteriaceae bacterium]
MSSIFTKIVRREIPAHIVAEDEHHLAFLDINPLVLGHTLVIPKLQVDYLFDLPDKAFTELNLFSKRVAFALREAVPCLRIGVAVIGLEVPHCHIHLIPMQNMDDINFSRPKLNPTSDQLTEVAAKIQKHYS